MSVDIRPARLADAARITEIYNAGVADRVVFQPVPREATHFEQMIESGALLLLGARAGSSEPCGAAWVSDYDPVNEYYAGVGEATVYVAPEARRSGCGRALLEALAEQAPDRGRFKLVAKIFASNEASLALFAACGYREVGVHARHGRLDGEWRDVVVVERLLAGAEEPPPRPG